MCSSFHKANILILVTNCAAVTQFLWQYTSGSAVASSWHSTLIGFCLSHRLRCLVLESAKPAIKLFKDSPVETGASEQQELNTAVSFGLNKAAAYLGISPLVAESSRTFLGFWSPHVCVCVEAQRGWSLSATARQGTFWTGHQSITETAKTRKQPAINLTYIFPNGECADSFFFFAKKVLVVTANCMTCMT